jgi:hypothetical protein
MKHCAETMLTRSSPFVMSRLEQREDRPLFCEVGQLVKHALGLTRMDATLQKWLRQAKRDLGVEQT